MSKWLDERLHRLRLSVDRLEEGAKLAERDGIEPGWNWFMRKESSICLKRVLALWWDLRWGRR